MLLVKFSTAKSRKLYLTQKGQNFGLKGFDDVLAKRILYFDTITFNFTQNSSHLQSSGLVSTTVATIYLNFLKMECAQIQNWNCTRNWQRILFEDVSKWISQFSLEFECVLVNLLTSYGGNCTIFYSSLTALGSGLTKNTRTWRIFKYHLRRLKFRPYSNTVTWDPSPF